MVAGLRRHRGGGRILRGHARDRRRRDHGAAAGDDLEAQGLPKAQVLHLAVGTAMATILFTSVASVRAHAARGAIRWDIARNVTPGILLGGLVGSWIASFIPPLVFAAIFTAVIYVAATNLLIDRKPKPSRQAPGFA